MTIIDKLARNWRFARHIPLRQIAARGAIALRRRSDGIHPPRVLARPTPPLTSRPPMPVFAPRRGMIERTATGWRFTFLHQSIDQPATIDWRIPASSSQSQLWRMNLHYMEYLEELDAGEGLCLIRQWIACNPPLTRGSWFDAWNSYTISIRVVCWMQFLARTGCWPPDVVRSLAVQLRILLRYLERDIGGNHLIKNIKALAWGGACFDGSEAAQWARCSATLLSSELDRQILADGMHYERSPSYHCQVLADLTEIRHVTGDVPAAALDPILADMARAAAAMVHPDGTPALFNDAGLRMAYPPARCVDAVGAVTGQFCGEVRGGFALTTAGYYGWRGDRMTLIADMGPIGPDALIAHAHGDIGSFELSCGGHRFIVDPGVFQYVAGPERHHARSAASHNCVAVDGGDQAEFFGAFRCGSRPTVSIDHAVASSIELDIAGCHDGYARTIGGPIVRRRIRADDRSVTIVDELSGDRVATGSIGFLLHPGCTVSVEENIATIRRENVAIQLTSQLPIIRRQADWCPDMGDKQSTIRLVVNLLTAKSTELETTIRYL